MQQSVITALLEPCSSAPSHQGLCNLLKLRPAILHAGLALPQLYLLQRIAGTCVPTAGVQTVTPLLQAELAAFKRDREGDQGRLKALTKELHDLQARSKDRQAALDREVGTMHFAEGQGGH